jgi:hypothetical protein
MLLEPQTRIQLPQNPQKEENKNASHQTYWYDGISGEGEKETLEEATKSVSMAFTPKSMCQGKSLPSSR